MERNRSEKKISIATDVEERCIREQLWQVTLVTKIVKTNLILFRVGFVAPGYVYVILSIFIT